MSMSRRDYVKVANVIRTAREDSESLQYIEDKLADIFAADNPRFDRERFAKACEVKP